LLPVHEVLRRRDFERVAFDPRAAMGGRAQPNDLRREADRPVVAVPCDVVEAGEDRHTLSCYTKTAFILRDFAMQFLDRLAPPPLHHPLGQGGGQPRAGPRAITTLERTIRLNRRRNGGWNRGGRGLRLARRDILRPAEDIAGVKLAFNLAQTRIDLVWIGRA